MPPEPRPDRRSDALDPARRLTRRERHHLEIVLLALRDDLASASALAREHLADFPDDAVIAQLLARWEGQ